MKVLWLSYRISASVIINALLVFSVDRFNRITNYHGNIVWYALKVWTFLTPQLVTVSHYQSRSCSSSIRMRKKKRLKSGLGFTEHCKTAKKNRTIRHIHAKNSRANHRKFRMFRNTTISEFKTTVTKVPHENLPNTIIQQTFSLEGAKNVKLYQTLPSRRQTFDSKCPTVQWAKEPRGNANA